MKKIVFAILASLILICFSGCSKGIAEGTIYKREFVAEHTETIIIPIVHSTGETCYTTMIPVIRMYPDEWIVSVKKYNKDLSEWETKDFYVSQQVYDKVEVGDYYVFNKKDGTTDEPYTQENSDEKTD